MDLIPKLIRDLHDAKEWAACRELALFYLHKVEDNEILFLLGAVYHEEKKFDKALECLELFYNDELEPHKKVNVLVNKANCLYYLKRAPEAERIIRSLPPDIRNDEALIIDLALYMNSQGKEREAAKLLAPIADTNVRAAFNYGWHLMAEDKLLEGYKYVRVGARDELRVWGHEWILRKNYNIGDEYRWKPFEEVDTIAFYLEGGMGDGMIFVRYAEQFKQYCKTVKIFAPEQIKPLLEECGYENVFVDKDIGKMQWDKYVPAMSAPYFLGLNDPMEGVTFPYLKRESKPVSEMNVVAQGKKKICIRWMGNPEFEHEQFRTIPIEKLLGLSKFGQLFSVQLDGNDLPKNANVWDLAPIIKSWSDTYDIFEESDLIITSCTSVAQLASAMGARVIVMPPINSYITWNTKNLRWYPDNVVVLHQMEYNNWDKTIDKLYEIMENWEW